MRGFGLREIEPRLRGAAFFPLAAYVVHQLRYLLAAGGDAGHELQAQGHAYLSWVTLPITLLAASGAGAFAAHLVVSRAGAPVREAGRLPRRFVAGWAVLAGSLLAVYAGQELLEESVRTLAPDVIGVELGGAPRFLKVGELRLGVLHALVGFAPRGCLVFLLEHEQGIARLHLHAARHREGLQQPGKGRRHPHLLALRVALVEARLLVGASREDDERHARSKRSSHRPE